MKTEFTIGTMPIGMPYRLDSCGECTYVVTKRRKDKPGLAANAYIRALRRCSAHAHVQRKFKLEGWHLGVRTNEADALATELHHKFS